MGYLLLPVEFYLLLAAFQELDSPVDKLEYKHESAVFAIHLVELLDNGFLHCKDLACHCLRGLYILGL
jgi:hypothetical protein